jgi:catechol 2,3-dioxygenase-like lactoylglutathione lyase family enzyme/ABC-type transport system involved in multi-copper enzyme maturation permease subunit
VIAQTRAELLKIRSTRTTLGLVLGMIGLLLLFTLLSGLLTHVGHLTSKEDQRGLLAVGSLAGVFSALAGILVVTSEYRFGTIRPTFLFTPSRSRVMAAKLAASVLAGLVFGVVGEGLGFGLGYVILASRGVSYALNGGDTALLVLGAIGSAAVWGAIGVGVGAVIRNQVGAVVTLLAWGFVVDNLLFGLVPSIGRLTPTRAQDALMGLTVNHLLSPESIPTTEVSMSTIDEEMVLAHFIVSDDVERSRRFYTEVLGGKTVISGEAGDEVTYVALANSWIIINVGGGPTDDKPTVTLETPPDPDRVSSFLNIRVADIQAVYAEWSARGAQFLTPPKQHETEIRCYIRDPDGYLIEVGQTTLARGWRPPS